MNSQAIVPPKFLTIDSLIMLVDHQTGTVSWVKSQPTSSQSSQVAGFWPRWPSPTTCRWCSPRPWRSRWDRRSQICKALRQTRLQSATSAADS